MGHAMGQCPCCTTVNRKSIHFFRHMQKLHPKAPRPPPESPSKAPAASPAFPHPPNSKMNKKGRFFFIHFFR